jgi:Putative Actinobacterial Holin-X, holin superfamily III
VTIVAEPFHGEDDLTDASFGELVKQLTQGLGTLARQEIQLAKAELSQKAKQAGVGTRMFGAATVAGLMALVALTACLIATLDLVMPIAVAAIIVTVIWAAVAGVLALAGRNRMKAATPPVPEQTVESVKEDVQWLKSRMSSGNR